MQPNRRLQFVEETTDGSEEAPLVVGLHGLIVADDPCELNLSERPEVKLSPEERRKMVDAVVSFYNSAQCPEEVKLHEDFEAKDLTPAKIRYLCNAMDRLFYRGRLLRKTRVKYQSEIWFCYEQFAAEDSKLQPCAKTVFSSRADTDEKELVKVIFHFNINRFGDSARCRETNGIQVRHKLEALITTTLHELAHLYWRVSCGKGQSHNAKFRSFNHAINGAHPRKFGYHDLESCAVHDRYHKERKM